MCSAAELTLPKGALTTMIPFLLALIGQWLVDLGHAAGDNRLVFTDHPMQLGNRQTDFKIDLDAGIIKDRQ